MSLRNILPINKGSDSDLDVQWYEDETEASAVLDLTGFTVEVYDVHSALAGHISVAIPTPANGKTPIAINWQDDMPSGAIMHFRLRISDGRRTSTEEIVVQIE